MLRKELIGFAAIEKETGKGLACSYGITNRLSLTDDPDKVLVLPQSELIETHIVWFNNTHKNQKEFEIKKVVRITSLVEEE
jgi:hypothetical protein